MRVNGENIEITKETNLYEFLTEQGYNTLKIAVELNGDIVPKSNYKNVTLKNDDTIEVVSFVGGG